MRYLSFEFENFKGIQKARLDLSSTDSARVFTLVGLNESGKTTVLEAIDQFQAIDPSGAEVSPKELAGWLAPYPHELIPIADRANFNGQVSIRCQVQLDDEDVERLGKHLRSATGFRLQSVPRDIEVSDDSYYANSRLQRRHTTWSGLSITGRARTGNVTRTIDRVTDTHWRAASMYLGSQLPLIWFFPNFLFDFPNQIFVEEIANESQSNRFYRALFQDILDALNRNLKIHTHIIDRARSSKSSERENLQAVLLEAGRHVTQTVVSAWNEIFEDNPLADKAVRIDYGFDEDDDLYIAFRLEDVDGLFSISERSLGFRWFFVYLLMTTYRGRRKSDTKEMLFLFDEPASNLHSTAQSALLSSLGDLSRDAVIIYATHSHHLINPEWLESTFVVKNEGLDPRVISADFTARRTSISVTPYRQFAAEHPNQSHYFQPILDVLDYAPSRLELVPNVVMVEGKTDFYILSYFQEVLATQKDKVLHLLPGGGAGTLDRPIQLYLAWSRPFVALLDSDEGGQRERDRYLLKFGLVVEGRLIDLRSASGNRSAKSIESLLPREDRLAIQRVADPSAGRYTKKGFARGVQEALVMRHHVKMSAEGRRHVNAVLKSLRKSLDAVAESIETRV